MFEVKHIGSAGQTVNTFAAKDEAHVNRLRTRVEKTFKQGSSETVKVKKI